MAFDILVSTRVQFKISAAISYIEDVCYNRLYAKKLYEVIESSVSELETRDDFHAKDLEVSQELGLDVYRIKLGKHRPLYVIDRPRNSAIVFSFIHEAQDFEKIVALDFANAT